MTVIDRTKIEKKAKAVVELLENTPDGIVFDVDTILADLFEKADLETTGIAAELLGIWARSDDRASVEQLFCLMTDCDFEDYLDLCIANRNLPLHPPAAIDVRVALGFLCPPFLLPLAPTFPSPLTPYFIIFT